jgi:hypothetical protein
MNNKMIRVVMFRRWDDHHKTWRTDTTEILSSSWDDAVETLTKNFGEAKNPRLLRFEKVGAVK